MRKLLSVTALVCAPAFGIQTRAEATTLSWDVSAPVVSDTGSSNDFSSGSMMGFTPFTSNQLTSITASYFGFDGAEFHSHGGPVTVTLDLFDGTAWNTIYTGTQNFGGQRTYPQSAR